jgi:hypothetical protein
MVGIRDPILRTISLYMCTVRVTLHMSNRCSTSFHTPCSISLVTCPAASLVLALKWFRSLFCPCKRNSLYVPRKGNCVKSGLLGGHRIEPPLPVYLPGNAELRNYITCLEKFGGAPSCWWPLAKLSGEMWRYSLLCVWRQSLRDGITIFFSESVYCFGLAHILPDKELEPLCYMYFALFVWRTKIMFSASIFS